MPLTRRPCTRRTGAWLRSSLSDEGGRRGQSARTVRRRAGRDGIRRARRPVPPGSRWDLPPRQGLRQPDGRAGPPLLRRMGVRQTGTRSRRQPRPTSSSRPERTRTSAAFRSRRSSSSRSTNRTGRALLAYRRDALVDVRPGHVEELERERGVEGRPREAQPVVEGELRVPERRLGAVREPRRDRSARSSSSSSGTQSETSPIRSASTPSIGSHSSRWYFAFASPQSSGQMIAAWSPAATPSFVWPSTIRAVRRRDRDVRKQADGESGADGGPGHRRDDRLRAVDHVVDEVAGLVEDPLPRRRVLRDLEHQVEVAASAERPVGAAHDHRACLVVRRRSCCQTVPAPVHRAADSVQLARARAASAAGPPAPAGRAPGS